MCELGKKYNVDMPTYNPKKLGDFYKEISIVKNTEKWHKQKFQMAIDIMKYPENLKRAVHELLEDAVLENVKYMEIRFAPRLHVTESFVLKDVLDAFSSALIDANKKLDIVANGIICFRASYDNSDVKEVLDIASEFLDKRIVAVDLVGIEEDGFANKWIKQIAYAQKLGFKTTIHSGEMLISKNVKKAIELLKTERIGHGFMIDGDKEQIDLIIKHDISIEICLTSNVKRLEYDYSRHPFKKFFDLGIKLSLNTDNRTLSNTNMNSEVQHAFEVFGLTKDEYLKIYNDSVEKSFATEEEKVLLKIEKM